MAEWFIHRDIKFKTVRAHYFEHVRQRATIDFRGGICICARAETGGIGRVAV